MGCELLLINSSETSVTTASLGKIEITVEQFFAILFKLPYYYYKNN
jgi:hypothetical protein